MIIAILFICLAILIGFMVVMFLTKGFQGAKIPEMVQNPDFFQLDSFWEEPIDAFPEECEAIFAGSSTLAQFKECGKCHVFDFSGHEDGRKSHLNDFVSQNPTVLNYYDISVLQSCRTVDQITTSIGFHKCEGGKSDCVGVFGNKINSEFFPNACDQKIPLCSGVLGSICFGYSTQNSEKTDSDGNKYKNVALSNAIGAEFTLEPLNTFDGNQKFRIVRCSFIPGSPDAGDFPSKDGKGSWAITKDGAFAYIIHKNQNKALVKNDNSDSTFAGVFSLIEMPTPDDRETILQWLLISPEEITSQLPGIDQQRCNYIPGAINVAIPQSSSYQPTSSSTLASTGYYTMSFSDDDGGKNAGLTTSYVAGVGYPPMSNESDNYLTSGFITSSGSYPSQDDMETNVKSQYWKFGIVDPSFRVQKGTIMIQDGGDGDTCRASYCPSIAYVSTTGGSVSKTQKPTLPSKLGDTVLDGTVEWEAVDPYKFTNIFDAAYLNSFGSGSLPSGNLVLGIAGGSPNAPGKCPQQLGYVTDDQRTKFREILSQTGQMSVLFILSDKNPDKTTKLTDIQVVRLKGRDYTEMTLGGSNLQDVIDGEWAKFSAPVYGDLTLQNFVPYDRYAYASGSSNSEGTPILCNFNNKSSLNQPSPGDPVGLSETWMANFNRVQFIPYGTQNSYKQYTADESLPSF